MANRAPEPQPKESEMNGQQKNHKLSELIVAANALIALRAQYSFGATALEYEIRDAAQKVAAEAQELERPMTFHKYVKIATDAQDSIDAVEAIFAR